MTSQTNFKLFSQTPVIGANFENLVIYANDLISSGLFAQSQTVAKLPYLLLSRQIGNDGQTYLLAQFRGTAGGTAAAPTLPLSTSPIIVGTGGTTAFNVSVNSNPNDINGSDASGGKGVFGGFCVFAGGTAMTANVGDYTPVNYQIVLPYDIAGTTSITINVGDFVWLRSVLTSSGQIPTEEVKKTK